MTYTAVWKNQVQIFVQCDTTVTCKCDSSVTCKTIACLLSQLHISSTTARSSSCRCANYLHKGNFARGKFGHHLMSPVATCGGCRFGHHMVCFPRVYFQKVYFMKASIFRNCIFQKVFFRKCIFPKCVFAKCTLIACFLSFKIFLDEEFRKGGGSEFLE